MPYGPLGKDVMLDALGAVAVWASLHDGDPGTTGANELPLTGTPAYIRKLTSWAAASSGSMVRAGADPVFDVIGGTTVLYVGLWSAVSAGTFYGYFPINGGSIDGVGSGDVADLITSVGHGLVADDRVFFKKPVGGTLPDLIIEGTLYFVVTSALTVDAFKVAATSEGTPIDIGVKGQVYYQKVIPEVFGAQGTLTLDTATLKLEE